MEKEHRCQTPKNHCCLNNCGFFGSLVTMNLCSQSTQSASRPSSSLPALWPSTSELSGSVEEKSSWCSACKKWVGLIGNKCRYGTMSCGAHRYPEKHNCNYDFKKARREEIAKANPLVVA
ncbi:hypothetical protein K2173_018600 [Erythroxylum novogranatense]|uniref:AN1-type domain-containing protein n=1 Tax=Erythroxylum novogranatense TaxID=1862640 RepID=A0AAV8UDS4_9ROSI|nr:hypothetical protein K2173_018600 [Erythroxylum novogranatense]